MPGHCLVLERAPRAAGRSTGPRSQLVIRLQGPQRLTFEDHFPVDSPQPHLSPPHSPARKTGGDHFTDQKTEAQSGHSLSYSRAVSRAQVSRPSVQFSFHCSFFFFFNLFIYGCVRSSFLREGFLQLQQVGATPHRGARASHYCGLSCCGAQAPDAQAQQLWLTGLVALRHAESSQTRARTRVPCIGRQILNHCATREALHCSLLPGPQVSLGIFNRTAKQARIHMHSTPLQWEPFYLWRQSKPYPDPRQPCYFHYLI